MTGAADHELADLARAWASARAEVRRAHEDQSVSYEEAQGAIGRAWTALQQAEERLLAAASAEVKS